MSFAINMRFNMLSIYVHRLHATVKHEITGATSRLKASRGQRYPCPAISASAIAGCRQGCGSNREQCPVEHMGEIPSVCPSVLLSIWCSILEIA